MSSRPVLAALAAASALLAATAGTASAHTGGAGVARPTGPTVTGAALTGAGAIRHTTLQRPVRAAGSAAWWGGPYRTSNGESVTIFTSDFYPVDDAASLRLAEFFVSLLHGAELSRLTVNVAPQHQVKSMCGSSEALGCYSPRSEEMVVSPEDVGGATAAEIITHEYGHHVATNRLNAPWFAGEWGTKRWSSYENVCARARAGTAFPGDEGKHYDLNPGEAFAEAYRLANEKRRGSLFFNWPIIDESFFPDDGALKAVEDDVLRPWQKPTTVTLRGRFAGAARARGFTVATPLDGRLAISLAAPAGYRLTLLDARRRTVLATGGRSATTTLCGVRSLTVRVTRGTKPARFSLRVSRP